MHVSQTLQTNCGHIEVVGFDGARLNFDRITTFQT